MQRKGWLRLAAGLMTLGALGAPASGFDVDPAEAFEVLVTEPLHLDNLPLTPDQPFEIDVVIEGEAHTLLLGAWSLRSDKFRVLTIGDDGIPTPYAIGAPLTVRGGSLQDPTIIVAGSLLPEGLKVVVTRMDADQVTWGIEPMLSVDPTADRAHHVIYRTDESLATGLCGNDPNAADHQHEHEGDQGEVNGRTLLLTEIAHDADFQFYQLNGSSEPNTVNDIENVMATVTAIYERDAGVTYEATDILIRTSSGTNPYTSNDASTLLNQFRSHWLTNHGAIARDTAHLWTGRTVNGSTIGIAFTIGGICSTSSYCLSQSRFTGNFASRVALTAHEIGHLYGAWHCNQNPNVSSPCNIMCSGLGGCNGVGLPNFGPQSIDFITAHAATRNCLEEIPENLVVPIVDNFDGASPFDPFIWESGSAAGGTTLAAFEPSGDRSMTLFGVGNVSSVSATFGGPDPIFVGLWGAANNVNPGQPVLFEYFDFGSGQFEELIRFEATENGQVDTLFEYKVAQLPASANGGDARFRLRSTGGSQWFIDSMRIGDVVLSGMPFIDPILGDELSAAHWQLPTLADASGGQMELSIFDSILSQPIQGDYWLNDSRPMFLSLDIQQSGLPAGMNFIAEVSDGGAGWTELLNVTAGGAGSAGPETLQAPIPLPSQTNGMQIRLRTAGTVGVGVFYSVDNVQVGDEVLVVPPACTGDIADDFGSLGSDGMVSFGDFLALLGLIGPCPGGTPGCTGDIADDFGSLGSDGMVSFGDFLALLGLIGPCP